MIYSLIHSIAWLLNRIPRSAMLPLARATASVMYYLYSYRRDLAMENIRKAFPEKTRSQHKAILKGTYKHYLVSMVDFIRIPEFRTDRLHKLVDFDGSYLDGLVAKKQGAIFVTGHFGSWEMINLTLGRLGYPLVGVAVKQQGAGGKYIKWVREQTESTFIGRRTSTRDMLRYIQSGHFLGLVSDQDARKRGIWIDFFGQPSSRYKGGAMFALQTGAPLVFGMCVMGKHNRYKIEFEVLSTEGLPDNKEEAIQALTQRINNRLEEAIRLYPEQYFWFHRMWKSKPQ